MLPVANGDAVSVFVGEWTRESIAAVAVEVHPFLGDLRRRCAGAAPGSRRPEAGAVGRWGGSLRQWLFGGVQGGRPEHDPTLEVVDVDDELKAAAVGGHERLGLDEVDHDLVGLLLGTGDGAPAGDDGTVVAHADPAAPGVGAMGVEGEVQGALGAHGGVG